MSRRQHLILLAFCYPVLLVCAGCGHHSATRKKPASVKVPGPVAKEFVKAVLRHDVSRVEEMLRKDSRLVHVNFEYDWLQGTTPLHFAAWTEDRALLRVLLAERADVDARAADGRTPLHIAARKGRAEIAARLVDAGADVNASDNRGVRPIHIAASHDSRAVAAMLIEHGADVRAEARYLGEPLHVAAATGSTAVARLLIANGASVNAGNGKCTPLHAVRKRHGPMQATDQ